MVKLLQGLTKLFVLMAVLFPLLAFGQEVTVRGTVTSADDGESLVGATVLVKGTTRGVITDDAGRFTIAVPNANSTLVVSYLGFLNQEVGLNGRSSVDVSLEREDVSTEEVIITGYTAQARKDITGAVSSIDAKDLLAVPTTGVEQALQGRAPGVTVVNEGGPGGNAMVRIRGFSTIGNNNPLYVIDGVPAQNGLNEINPNDIETIQVLKDASTASIYGARAANGVIIVTTKKGRIGEPSISFDAYYGVQSANNYPEMLNPQGLADLLWESFANAGIALSSPQYGSGATPVLPDYVFPAGRSASSPDVDPSLYNRKTYPIMKANKTGTNWIDEITRSAPQQNYQVSASGGNGLSRYNVSMNYFRQDGLLISTAFDRYTFRANSETRVRNRLTVGENVLVSFSRTSGGWATRGEGGEFMSALRMPQIIPVFDILGPENGGSYGGSKGAGLTNTNNPVAVLNRNADNRGRRLRTFGNVYGQLEIIKGLNAKSSIGIDYNQFAGSYFSPINYEAAEPSSANTLSEQFNLFYSWTWTNTLEYKPNLGDNMDLSVLAGTEAIDSYYRGFSAGRANFFTDNVDYRVLSAGTSAISNGGYQGSYALFSYFGKVDYSLNDRYILSATIRRDGSSRFGAANRFGNFPAVSAGWRVSEESFMDGGPFSDLKVRAGWGQTGNQFIGDYSTQSAYGLSRTTSSYDINGTNSSLVDGFDKQLSGNPNLKWEAVTSTNVGIDFGLFKNRLSGTLDLYERKTTGMLYRPTQPGTFGISSNPNQNIGEMRNRGIDFLVSFKSAPASDFTYDLSFNISTYQNEVLRLSEDVGSTLFSGGTRQGNTTKTTVGAPIAMFYGYEVLGIYQTAEEVAADGNPPGVTFATPADGIGRYRIKDVTGPGADNVLGTADDAPDGVLNSDDKTIIGNPHPDFTYGFNAAFGYKNFDLTIFLQGSQGNDLYNYTAYFTDYFSFQGNQSVKMAEQSWTPQNASTATLPKLNRNQPAYELEAHSRFIEDGSYLRVKNVQLGYTLPKSALSKIGFNRARIYVQATNLLTITKYTGFDPEVGVRDQFGDGTDLSIGLDDGAYPVSKTLVAGISLNL